MYVKKVTYCNKVSEPVHMLTRGHTGIRHLCKIVRQQQGTWGINATWETPSPAMSNWDEKFSPIQLLPSLPSNYNKVLVHGWAQPLPLWSWAGRTNFPKPLNSESILRCIYAFTYIMYRNIRIFIQPCLDQIHKQCKIKPHPAASYF